MIRVLARVSGVEWIGRVPFRLVVGVALMLGGCVGEKVTTTSSPFLERYQVRTVVVMPFQTLATPQVIRPDVPDLPVPGGLVRSDIRVVTPRSTERLDQPTSRVPLDAGMLVSRIVSRKLSRRTGLIIRSPAEAELEFKQLQAVEKEVTPAEAGRRVALRLKADAALTGLVRLYRERGGSKYGDDPAAVAFEVKLIAADGRVLWGGNYYEVQRPCNEDFQGCLKRGFGFLTAEKLTSYGAEQLVERFPFK